MKEIAKPNNDIVVYKSSDGKASFDVTIFDENVWLTQTNMVALFERDQSVIARHIKSTFVEEEVDEKSNMQKMHIANSDKPVTLYSLDVIIEEIIQSSKDDRLNKQLQKVKQDIKVATENPKSKNRIIRFFKEIGDESSDTNKAIRGTGVARKWIVELIRLGEKLKDWIP